jgi:Xaa-Pro aminopeptidase
VFFSYAIVTENKVSLFVNANQLDQRAHKYLDGVTDLHPYEAFLPTLREVAGGLQLNKENVRSVRHFTKCVPYMRI